MYPRYSSIPFDRCGSWIAWSHLSLRYRILWKYKPANGPNWLRVVESQRGQPPRTLTPGGKESSSSRSWSKYLSGTHLRLHSVKHCKAAKESAQLPMESKGKIWPKYYQNDKSFTIIFNLPHASMGQLHAANACRWQRSCEKIIGFHFWAKETRMTWARVTQNVASACDLAENS